MPGLEVLAPVGEPLLVDGRLELRGRVGEHDDADAAAGARAPLLPLHDRRRDERAELVCGTDALQERLPAQRRRCALTRAA